MKSFEYNSALNSQKYYDAVENSQLSDNLQVIETSATEYPRDWQCAIIGFENWEQIQAFCEEEQFRDSLFGSSIVTPVVLHRRDGQQFWNRTGNTAYKPFDCDTEDIIGDGSRYSVYYRKDFKDYEDFRAQEILPFINSEDEDEWDECEQRIVRNANALWKDLESCDDNHAIRYDCVNGYSEEIELHCIEYYRDTHRYLIGVEIDFPADEENDEDEDYN